MEGRFDMGKKLTPQQIADKQVKRSMAAVQDFKDGVSAVTESPTKKAAERADAWFAGISQAHADGKFVEGCNDCTLEDWKAPTLKKGAMTYATGVQDAAGKIADFHQQRAQQQQAIDAILAGMPRGDLAQNIQRMVAQVQGMSSFKFKKRRRG